ncbi:MAG: signal peptide peptidase SppA [Candidatus Mcinerneyibacterium aminivorans]|uniref:Signal peptide peptidase SppA n=1 Tax=Candidatus Mcinerneyibacterium aminivorans TaxID=2703815 RepID=A0A5D0MMI6_9BACT|nr:MAG: signal peptide peptidase SppA [Candidatus Mcinerneyibacterium aminivorans]
MKNNKSKGCLVAFLIFTVFVGLGILFIFLSISKYTQPKTYDVESNSFVKIDLSKKLPYKEEVSYFKRKSNLTFFDLLNSLEKIKNDNNINGIILEDLSLPRAQREEILAKIKNIQQAGKKVYAFTSNINRYKYSALSIANKIILTPSESNFLMIRGYYYSRVFLKRLFTKLGIDFNVIHIGNYKGAGEMFSRNEMSPYMKENITKIIDSFFETDIENIVKNRNLNNKEFTEEVLNGEYFLFSPKKALDNNLVDELLYRNEFYKKYNINNKKIIEINKYSQSFQRDLYKSKIAVIVADGNIVLGESKKSFNPLFGDQESVGSDTFIKMINKVMEDENVKGVIIRVDSPGGSALASDLMWNAVEKLKKKKPVYVSMGNMAASGGYYISCNADKIYANSSTITGSIGVVAMIPDFSEFLKNKLYLNFDHFKKGKYTNFGNTSHITEAELTLIEKSMRRTYIEFKTRVAKGRNKSSEYIENIAQGKVYTGQQALDNGLIDEIGDFSKVVADMKKNLKTDNLSLEIYPKPKSFFEKLSEGNPFLSSTMDINSKINTILEYDSRPKYLFPYVNIIKQRR